MDGLYRIYRERELKDYCYCQKEMNGWMDQRLLQKCYQREMDYQDDYLNKEMDGWITFKRGRDGLECQREREMIIGLLEREMDKRDQYRMILEKDKEIKRERWIIKR